MPVARTGPRSAAGQRDRRVLAPTQAVETAVTTPIEQALNGVEGMLYMTSSSTNSGVSQITVTFDVTRNSDIAAVDVQNRVSQTLGRSTEVRALGVNVQKNSTGFVLGAASTRRTARATRSFSQLHRRLRERRAAARAGRGSRSSCSASGATRCVCGSIRTSSRIAT